MTDVNQKQPKAETHWKSIPNSGFALSFPCGVRTHCPPGTSICDDVLSNANQGGLPELWCPELWLEFHYVGMIDGALGHSIEFKLQLPSPLWGLGEYQLALSPSPLITQLVFLAWSAPVLSHLLRTDYQMSSRRTHHEQRHCCHLGSSQIYWLPPRNWGQRPAKFFAGDSETANDTSLFGYVMSHFWNSPRREME